MYGRLKLTEIRNDNKQRESYDATKKRGRKIGNTRGRGFSHEVVFRQEGKTAVFREIFCRRLRRPCIRGNPGLHVGKSVKFFDLVYQPSCSTSTHMWTDCSARRRETEKEERKRQIGGQHGRKSQRDKGMYSHTPRKCKDKLQGAGSPWIKKRSRHILFHCTLCSASGGFLVLSYGLIPDVFAIPFRLKGYSTRVTASQQTEIEWPWNW